MTRVLALSGGVGGAKLALGLERLLGADLTVVCNTGDDFEHLGLHISPDVDSVLYALGGVHDAERGWGRREETWRFLETLGELGGPTWFRLGDRDLALHVERTRRLAAGETLSSITADLARALGIDSTVAPMSDDPVRTIVETAGGDLPFQRYFVRERCEPVATGFRFEGAERAAPSPAFAAALESARAGALDAVVICPSNPFVSIDPILALPGVTDALRASTAPVVAVSPIVGGRALKGPAAKMMRELGLERTAVAVAQRASERGLLDLFVLDEQDREHEERVRALGLRAVTLPTVMRDERDKIELARRLLRAVAA